MEAKITLIKKMSIKIPRLLWKLINNKLLDKNNKL